MRLNILIFLVSGSLFGGGADFYDVDEIKEAWVELGLPVLSEDSTDFREEWVRWIVKKENQSRLLQKIKCQILEGGFDSSSELFSMVGSLELALAQWDEIGVSKDSSAVRIKDRLGWFACNIKKYRDEEVNEDNVEERIQELREEEKAHKDEALELVLQATAEAIGAGACAAGGMELPALVEGVQASRHFVKSCKEYNEGVRCQQEADALEKQYFQGGDQPEKKWWEFWK